MKNAKLLAIDLGASGGKCFAGIFENSAFQMKEIHRFGHECASFFLRSADGDVSERMYWDDTLIYNQIVTGLHSYRRDIGKVLDGIGIDTWGADGQIINKEGDSLGKMYAYRDHRLDNMVEEVKKRITPETIYSITGIHFQPFNVSNQLLWLVQNRKELLAQTYKFLPVPTLFYYYLGGELKVDSTWASVTQLMDAAKREWSKEVLEALGIPLNIMPEIVPPSVQVGTLDEKLAKTVGINPAPLYSVGSHDTASAFAAAPVDNTDEALIISSGTWSLVGKLIPNPITNAEAMASNISNEGGIGNIRFLKNCMGSWLIHELRRVWRDKDGHELEWNELYQLASSAVPFAAFIDPDCPIFYNPSNMEEAIIEFCRTTGQEAPKSRGSFLRTVYESLALKYRYVNEDIVKVCKKPTKVVHIVGGGSRNEMLNQFTANSLALPVLAGPVEATAVGNLMVQAIGCGIINSLHEAMPIIKKAFPITSYKPQDVSDWEKAYQKFVSIIKK